MKKGYERGFFLAETIVVIAAVAVILLNVYVTFSSVYSNYKRSEKYNTINALNAVNNIKKYYFSVGNIDQSQLATNGYILDLTDKTEYNGVVYNELKSKYDVSKVYLVDPKNIENSLDNVNINLRRFIKSLRKNSGVGLIVALSNNEYAYSKLLPKDLNCPSIARLENGMELIVGQFTYRYKQEYDGYTGNWVDMNRDGWGVKVTDLNSTEPISSKLCASISGKPIISTSSMFFNSKTTDIDLGDFDTSNVVNMKNMFNLVNVKSLDLSGFDTTNAEDMSYMFANSFIKELDLSLFDTSNVTDMSHMFENSHSSSINMKNVDISNVTDMSYMFSGVDLDSLDLSDFEGSSVLNIDSMFRNSKINSLNLSNLNLHNVDNSDNALAGATITEATASSIADAKTLNSSTNRSPDTLFVSKDYTIGQFLQSTGTQYVDSGYRPSFNTGVDVTFQFTDKTTQQRVFGTDSDSGSNKISYALYINGNTKYAYAYSNGGGNWVEVPTAVDLNQHNWKFNIESRILQLDNGNHIAISGTPNNGSNYNMYIFARNNMGVVQQYSKIKIYDFKIYEIGELVRHYKPCFNKLVGENGLCEIISNDFYGNKGTGQFILG